MLTGHLLGWHPQCGHTNDLCYKWQYILQEGRSLVLYLSGFEVRTAQQGVQVVFCLLKTSWNLPYNWGKSQKTCQGGWEVEVQFVVSTWPPCYRQPQLACWFPVTFKQGVKWFNIQQYWGDMGRMEDHIKTFTTIHDCLLRDS